MVVNLLEAGYGDPNLNFLAMNSFRMVIARLIYFQIHGLYKNTRLAAYIPGIRA